MMTQEDSLKELDRIAIEVLEEAERIMRLQAMGVQAKCISCPEARRNDFSYCQECEDMEEFYNKIYVQPGTMSFLLIRHNDDGSYWTYKQNRPLHGDNWQHLQDQICEDLIQNTKYYGSCRDISFIVEQ